MSRKSHRGFSFMLIGLYLLFFEVAMNYKIRKTAEQLANNYYPLGQKGDEYGGNANQENEVPEEINEDMEARDQENYTPGQDNIIIDKMDSAAVDPGTILASLKELAILVKGSYARDLIKTTMRKIEGCNSSQLIRGRLRNDKNNK